MKAQGKQSTYTSPNVSNSDGTVLPRNILLKEQKKSKNNCNWLLTVKFNQ